MIYKILNKLDCKTPFDQVSAHCDIPCKIYDPISAQLSVLTMIRMIDLLDELNGSKVLTFEQQATFNRLVSEKEVHGTKVKEEIRIIWGDYFKQPQLEIYPEIHQLAHEIMLVASFTKQHIKRDQTLVLLDKVNQFSEIFWRSKGISVYRAKSPYPPAEVLVYPDLKA